jgi:hypothetical protein
MPRLSPGPVVDRCPSHVPSIPDLPPSGAFASEGIARFLMPRPRKWRSNAHFRNRRQKSAAHTAIRRDRGDPEGHRTGYLAPYMCRTPITAIQQRPSTLMLSELRSREPKTAPYQHSYSRTVCSYPAAEQFPVLPTGPPTRSRGVRRRPHIVEGQLPQRRTGEPA